MMAEETCRCHRRLPVAVSVRWPNKPEKPALVCCAFCAERWQKRSRDVRRRHARQVIIERIEGAG